MSAGFVLTEVLMSFPQVSKDKVDYAELIFSKNHHSTPGPTAMPANPPQGNGNVSPAAAEDIPPALPYRSTTADNDTPNQKTNTPPGPALCSPSRLYPCLQVELGALSVQNVVRTFLCHLYTYFHAVMYCRNISGVTVL